MNINYVCDLFFFNKNLYCSGKCCALLSELAVVAVCQDSSVALCRWVALSKTSHSSKLILWF